MKLAHLIWSGLWRSPTRSAFTMLSVAVAFVLFGLLQGLNAGFDLAIRNARLDTLTTIPRVPDGALMPISALSQIQRVPGVLVATQRGYFIGAYQEPKNTVALLAIDASKWFAVRPAFAISKGDLRKFILPCATTCTFWRVAGRGPAFAKWLSAWLRGSSSPGSSSVTKSASATGTGRS